MVGASSLAGCSGLFDSNRVSGPREVDSVAEFDNQVNVEVRRREQNLTSVDSIISDVDDSTLLYFPPGEYIVEESLVLEDVSDVALIGEDATLVRANPIREDEEYLLSLIGNRLHVEGFSIDYTEEGHGGRFQVLSSGDFVVRDITVVGENSGTGLFVFEVRDSDGEGLVERVQATDGGPNSDGLFVAKDHSGALRIDECRIFGFKGNGIYASAPGLADGGGGVVVVHGGEYRNNNIANIRLGTSGSSVSDTTIVVDSPIPPTNSGVVNSRGIWLHGGTDLIVENCSITLSPPAKGDGALVMGKDTESATVRDTEIVVNASVPAINLVSPEEVSQSSSEFLCEDVRITGGASGGFAVSVVDRDGCRFTGMQMTQHGEHRDGFLFQRSQGNVVRELDIDVSGQPFVLREASTVDVIIDESDQTKLANDSSVLHSYDSETSIQMYAER
ncbi:right-handed parallel beta-helix repeat-containing protein [Halomarina rubra]|uniref:Right-handed parallel beta-helix repeat-containing protein n=1 Tax=Halomarina rubra TaxID=2071873 RepID=A0ABD6AWW9_9EURY|nr:right-handed parallel beta-helix repeat-containing protein [Halomarina rubra]